MKQKTVLIVGLGLIGGSYARGLSKRGYTVLAIDIDADGIAYAKQQGWIEAGSTDVDPTLMQRAELVICGLYPKRCVTWILEHQSLLRPHTLLCDVCGVKTGIVSAIQEGLRSDLEFIGTHPMAGREVSGTRYADDAIFQGANFIITPTERNSREAIRCMEQLAEELGFQTISCLSVEEHDQVVGYVSQLTHTIAVSLMNATDTTRVKPYTGDSFRDLTRIARINETLWTELFLLNRKHLVDEMDAFIAEMEALKQAIIDEDTDTMRKKFVESTKRRMYLD